jgi:hypothetical protein
MKTPTFCPEVQFTLIPKGWRREWSRKLGKWSRMYGRRENGKTGDQGCISIKEEKIRQKVTEDRGTEKLRSQ